MASRGTSRVKPSATRPEPRSAKISHSCLCSARCAVVETVAQEPGVFKVNFDFCMLGMQTADADGNAAPARKRTGILTNSHAIAVLLREAQCRGDHKHPELLAGKAGQCQEYPDKFCRLVCEGVKKEIETTKWRTK